MSGPTLIQKRVLAYLINDITNKHPKNGEIGSGTILKNGE